MTTNQMCWPFLLGIPPLPVYNKPFSMTIEKPSMGVSWKVTESDPCTQAEAQGTEHHTGTHRSEIYFFRYSNDLDLGMLVVFGSEPCKLHSFQSLCMQWTSSKARKKKKKKTAAKRKSSEDKGPLWKYHFCKFKTKDMVGESISLPFSFLIFSLFHDIFLL